MYIRQNVISDSYEKTETFKCLLENGASPNVSDANGTFLLERIFQQMKNCGRYNNTYHRFTRDDLVPGLKSVFYLLLHNGADPNRAEVGQDSLLLQAIERSDMEDVVKTLVEFGADLCHVGENQRTAFEECCLKNENGK
jgi:ankyrin repeat protein